jgi:cyclase
MLRTRIIPVLLLQNRGLTKTIRFQKGKYIGDPINAVKIFNDKEVDELIIFDIDASKENKRPDFDLINDLASECFMPLGYGGGIKDIDDIKKLFDIGVEKVIINNSALLNLSIINEASKRYGDQSIVVCVDIIKTILGRYQVYSHVKGKSVSVDLSEFIKNVISSGAGEIILQSVDRDGMMNGYDLSIIHKVANNINVPLVACGGAGTIEDLKKGADAGASALAAGSMFVFHGPHKAVLINYPSLQQLGKGFKTKI